MTTNQIEMTYELDRLINLQISTLKQVDTISNSDLTEFRLRSRRIEALYVTRNGATFHMQPGHRYFGQRSSLSA